MPKGVYDRTSTKLICPKCSKELTGKGGLAIHMSVAHGVPGVRHNPKKGAHTNGTSHTAVSNNNTEAQGEHIAYCFGHTEAFLQAYADSAGLSRSALTSGVAGLLARKTRRSLLGT